MEALFDLQADDHGPCVVFVLATKRAGDWWKLHVGPTRGASRITVPKSESSDILQRAYYDGLVIDEC
jgi:hypothetical protein